MHTDNQCFLCGCVKYALLKKPKLGPQSSVMSLSLEEDSWSCLLQKSTQSDELLCRYVPKSCTTLFSSQSVVLMGRRSRWIMVRAVIVSSEPLNTQFTKKEVGGLGSAMKGERGFLFTESYFPPVCFMCPDIVGSRLLYGPEERSMEYRTP